MNEFNNVTFNFEKLDVYQKSLEFLDLVYKISTDFPKKELFAFVGLVPEKRDFS